MSQSPDPAVQFDQGTFLAARAIEAEQIGPVQPMQVVLPGAKTAIPHDVLLAHQELERSEHEIVARVNAQWERDNADRLKAHKQWVAGAYATAVQVMRELEAQSRAEQLRQQTEFQQRLQQRLEEQ